MMQWYQKKAIIEASKLDPFDLELDDINKMFKGIPSKTFYDSRAGSTKPADSSN